MGSFDLQSMEAPRGHELRDSSLGLRQSSGALRWLGASESGRGLPQSKTSRPLQDAIEALRHLRGDQGDEMGRTAGISALPWRQTNRASFAPERKSLKICR